MAHSEDYDPAPTLDSLRETISEADHGMEVTVLSEEDGYLVRVEPVKETNH